MEEKKVKVNGEEVSEEKLQELKKNPKIRLHEETPDNYRILNRMTE